MDAAEVMIGIPSVKKAPIRLPIEDLAFDLELRSISDDDAPEEQAHEPSQAPRAISSLCTGAGSRPV